MPLELILGAVDVPEPLQRIRAQGETEAGPVGRMNHAVRTDVERRVEELPHHRHPALADLKNVAVRGCHRDVNAGGKQNATAPGMRGQAHAVRRGQCRNTPDLGDTAGAGDVGLRDVQCTALEQILEVESRELALPRGNGDCRRSAHLRLTGVIVGRDRLLEPGDVVGLELPGELDGRRNLERAMRVDHQFDFGAESVASRLDPAHTVGDREAVTPHHPHLGGGEALRGVARQFRLGLLARRPAAACIAPHRAARGTQRLVERNASASALTSQTATSMPAMASMMTPRRRLSSAWVMPRSSAGLLREPLYIFSKMRSENIGSSPTHSAASSCSTMAATIGGVPRAAPMPVSPTSVSTRISVASLLTLVPRSVR